MEEIVLVKVWQAYTYQEYCIHPENLVSVTLYYPRSCCKQIGEIQHYILREEAGEKFKFHPAGLKFPVLSYHEWRFECDQIHIEPSILWENSMPFGVSKTSLETTHRDYNLPLNVGKLGQ